MGEPTGKPTAAGEAGNPAHAPAQRIGGRSAVGLGTKVSYVPRLTGLNVEV
jgi:hypothetical protein